MRQLLLPLLIFVGQICACAQTSDAEFRLLQQVSNEVTAGMRQVNSLLSRNVTDSALIIVEGLEERVAPLKGTHRNLLMGTLLDRHAAIYARHGMYDEAIKTEEEAIANYSSAPKDTYIAVAYSNLAGFYSLRAYPGDLDNAVKYGELALKAFPGKSREKIISMYSLSNYYNRCGRTTDAQKLHAKAEKDSKSIFKKDIMVLAHVLSDNSVTEARRGNYTSAIGYAQAALDIYRENGQNNNLNYAKLLLNTASYYNRNSRYEAVITLLDEARPILLTLEGEEGTDYLRCMSELSAAHGRMGNIEKADDLAMQARQSAEQQASGKISPAVGVSHSKLAATFAANGNYESAINEEEEAAKIYQALGDSLAAANSYTSLAIYHNHRGQQDVARGYCERAMRIYNASKQNTDTHKSNTLNTLSTIAFAEGDNEEAYKYGKQALNCCIATNDTLSSRYAKICNSVGIYAFYAKEYEDAKALTSTALRIQTQILGPEHPDNIELLFNLAIYDYVCNDAPAMEKHLHQAITRQMDIVRNNFTHLPAADRERYWNTKKHIFYNTPEMIAIQNLPDTVAIDVYNSLLFTKGILLNSDIDFRNLLQRSASPEVQQKYEQLSLLYTDIETAYTKKDAELHKRIPSMRREAETLEREIVKKCKEFGDFTQGLSIRVEDVGKSLKEKQVALELFEVDVEGIGTTYMALYLCKDWKTPRAVRLFSEKDLAKHYGGRNLRQLLSTRDGINKVFADSLIGQLVWRPLINEWDGIKEIYFAPTGVFYQWGVEYLNLGNERICDRFQIHRLSSTKLLAQKKEKRTLTSASLFGGINYDASIEEMVATRDKILNGSSSWEDEFADLLTPIDEEENNDNLLADNAERGASLSYLPGTLSEVNTISEMLASNNIATHIYTGTEATEEAFQALSGSDNTLLHIATHGFALPAPSGQNELKYSGLMMAGASNACNGSTMPEGLENGILTSHEISRLNLSNFDLVILSACQTGLGNLHEDGVFGLQRGFKKAGAQTLLMSLWSVSDKATSLMMQYFYKGLIENGMSRSEAFAAAQKALRDSDYNAPYYWASFILLDNVE